MVGPKPKPVRPLSTKTAFEKPAEGKMSKKNKKPVVKTVETKQKPAKDSKKTTPSVAEVKKKSAEGKKKNKTDTKDVTNKVVHLKQEQVRQLYF